MTADSFRDFLVRHQAAFAVRRVETGWEFACNGGEIFVVSDTGTVTAEGSATNLTREVWNMISWVRG